MTSQVLWWVALGLLVIGAMRTQWRRLNDADEPLLPWGFAKWKHARVGVPWIAAAALLFAVGTVIRLLR